MTRFGNYDTRTNKGENAKTILINHILEFYTMP